nr:MAG TPA: hypothetical protein [Caudoviricetes sp.]
MKPLSAPSSERLQTILAALRTKPSAFSFDCGSGASEMSTLPVKSSVGVKPTSRLSSKLASTIGIHPKPSFVR